MAADIGQELYEKIKAEFDKRVSANGYIKAVTQRIADGTATMEDVSLYVRALGAQLSLSIVGNVSAAVLPEGQMYYNIAQKVLSPLLHDNHAMVNDIAARVQKEHDERRNIKIKPQKAPFPEERLSSVVSAASEQGLDEATMKRRMSAPAETMTQSFSDDYMETNARFRTRAGFKEYIVRKDDGKCCEWCSKLAGRYLYPESTPHDVFRRHDNCGCSVTYEDGGMRQDVWSKRTREASPEELAERRELEEKLKPIKLSPEEAAAKENELLEKRATRLTGSSESGIMEERSHFNTKNDPVREIFGSAEVSNPEEVKVLEAHLIKIGVQLERPLEERLSYEPSPIPGTPGKAVISQGASYSAWLHEVKHADDDMADGWLGMRVFSNPQKCAQREIDAYEIEINIAKKSGRIDIVERLEALRNDEIKKYGY